MGEIKILLNQFTFVKKQKPVAWVDVFFLLERKRRKIPGDQPQEETKKFLRLIPFAAWPRVFLHKRTPTKPSTTQSKKNKAHHIYLHIFF